MLLGHVPLQEVKGGIVLLSEGEMHKFIDLFGDNDEKRDAAIVVIRNGLVNNSLVADAEINLSATMVELTQL